VHSSGVQCMNVICRESDSCNVGHTLTMCVVNVGHSLQCRGRTGKSQDIIIIIFYVV